MNQVEAFVISVLYVASHIASHCGVVFGSLLSARRVCVCVCVCVLTHLNRPEQAMADCIWMETAFIASNLADHRDIGCSWVRKQGAIERDLSNEST